MITVGMDVHVRNSYLHVTDDAGNVMRRGRCRNTLMDLAEFLGPIEREAMRRDESASSVWWSPNGYVERGSFWNDQARSVRYRRPSLGTARPQTPRLQSPPERGLTPDGDAQEMRNTY